MCSADMPPSDYRMLINSGPFRLDPGEKTDFCYAVIWLQDQPHPCPDVEDLTIASEEIEDFYNGLTGTSEEVLTNAQLNIFPNPATDLVQFQITETGLSFQSIHLYDAQGRLLREPDRQVQDTLESFFRTFQRTGSATATVKYFRKQGWLFPRRIRIRNRRRRAGRKSS